MERSFNSAIKTLLKVVCLAEDSGSLSICRSLVCNLIIKCLTENIVVYSLMHINYVSTVNHTPGPYRQVIYLQTW